METKQFLQLAMVDEAMVKAKEEKERLAAEEAARKAAAVAKVQKVLEAGPVAKPGKELRLDGLTMEQRWALLTGAEGLTAKELAAQLSSYGYKASEPTVSRFVRKVRAEEALDVARDLGESAGRLAAVGQGAALRAGSVEAIRTQMFEQVLQCKDSEKRLRLYEALIGEEERLRKLALEEQKARQNQEALDLQRQRVQIEAIKSGAKFFEETLRILMEEGKAAELKVKLAVAELERWKKGAIQILPLKAGGTAGG